MLELAFSLSSLFLRTNRVHVMLPCLAYGTNVNFIINKANVP